MGHLSVRMSVISGPASVSGEGAEGAPSILPSCHSRSQYVTQNYVYDKETSAKFAQLVLYSICDESPVFGGDLGSIDTS